MEEHREKGSSRRSSDRRGNHRRVEHRRRSNVEIDTPNSFEIVVQRTVFDTL